MYTKGETRRFADALAIQAGACNPSGVAYSLVDALKELADENADKARKCSDPAVRLIVHQLAFLCGIAEIEDSLSVYGALTKACEAKA